MYAVGLGINPYQTITDALNAHDAEIKTPKLGADRTYQNIHAAIEEHPGKQALTSQIKTSSGTEISIPHNINSPMLNPAGITYTGSLTGFTIIRQAQDAHNQNIEGMAIVASYEALPEGKVKCSNIALPVGKDFTVQLIDTDGKDLLTPELRKFDIAEQVLIEKYLQANGAEGLTIKAKRGEETFNLCSAEEFAKAKGIEKQIQVQVEVEVKQNQPLIHPAPPAPPPVLPAPPAPPPVLPLLQSPKTDIQKISDAVKKALGGSDNDLSHLGEIKLDASKPGGIDIPDQMIEVLKNKILDGSISVTPTIHAVVARSKGTGYGK